VINTAITNTSYAPTTALSDGAYYWRVKAIDQYGIESAWSDVWSFAYSTTLPAPENVSASAGDNAATVSWDSVSGATSYNIYWSCESGVTKTNYEGKIEEITTTSYIHTGLTNGITYYYVVTAFNEYGESNESNEVVATPGQWVKLIGTGETDVGRGIGIDSNSNIYLAGYTYGDLEGNTNAGGSDIFIKKYDAGGVTHWTKLFGTPGSDWGQDVALDTNGNIYLTGYTQGDLDDITNLGSSDIFIAKYDVDGEKKWTKLLGTSLGDWGQGVAIDSNGSSYITGYTQGDLDGNAIAGSKDAFVAYYDTNGNKTWVRLLGTGEIDIGQDAAIDSNSNIYIVGYTNGDLEGNTNAGGSDIFIAKYNTDGTTQWTKLLGTSLSDYGQSIAVDSKDNIYTAGYTSGDLDGNTNAGGIDAFIAKYSSDGTKQWTKLLGSSADDRGYGIAVDSNGKG